MKPIAATSAHAAASMARLNSTDVISASSLTDLDLPTEVYYLRVETVCRPGDYQSHDVCCCVRRNGHKLGLKRRVSKTRNNGRNEKGEAGERHRDKEVKLNSD